MLSLWKSGGWCIKLVEIDFWFVSQLVRGVFIFIIKKEGKNEGTGRGRVGQIAIINENALSNFMPFKQSGNPYLNQI